MLTGAVKELYILGFVEASIVDSRRGDKLISIESVLLSSFLLRFRADYGRLFGMHFSEKGQSKAWVGGSERRLSK